MKAGTRTRQTGRLDTFYVGSALAGSVLLLTVSGLLAIIDHHHTDQAQQRLPRILFQVAHNAGLLPTDPSILPLVSARLPGHPQLAARPGLGPTRQITITYHRDRRRGKPVPGAAPTT